MTTLLVWSGVVLVAWGGWRALQWLASVGQRARRPVELWRVACAPPVHLIGFRARSASGAELVTVGVYSVATEPRGEQLTLLHEIATLTPAMADQVRDTMTRALTDRPRLGGLH